MAAPLLLPAICASFPKREAETMTSKVQQPLAYLEEVIRTHSSLTPNVLTSAASETSSACSRPSRPSSSASETNATAGNEARASPRAWRASSRLRVEHLSQASETLQERQIIDGRWHRLSFHASTHQARKNRGRLSKKKWTRKTVSIPRGQRV